MKIVLATENPGKIREFQTLLAPLALRVEPQSAYQIHAPEETGLSFIENALLKARHASLESGLPAMADDSGLAVTALQGAPGIYSARYAGPNASDQENVTQLLTALKDIPSELRDAYFYCVIAFVRHARDPIPIICQGIWRGRITNEPQGNNGFGYDPVFWIEERQCTSAQLDGQTKNQLSHRGQAVRAMIQELAKLDLQTLAQS